MRVRIVFRVVFISRQKLQIVEIPTDIFVWSVFFSDSAHWTNVLEKFREIFIQELKRLI